MIKGNQLIWLISLTKGYRKRIIIPIVLSILSILLSLSFVQLLRIIVDGINLLQSNFIVLIILLVLSKLFQFACEEGESYYRSKTNAILENAYSLRCFKKIFDSNSYYVRSFHSGDEMSRLTTDVGIVTQCVSYTIPIIIYAIAQLILTLVYLLSIKPTLTIFLVCIMPLMIIVARYYTNKLIPLSKEIRNQDAKLNEYMQEHLQKHEILASLGVTKYITSTVKNMQQLLLSITNKQIRYDVAAEVFIDLGFCIGYIAVMIWGLIGIREGNFTYAMLLVFLELVGHLERPFILLKSQYPVLINSFASADRIMELDNFPNDEMSQGTEIEAPIGILIENISFSYGNHSVFKDFSCNIIPNAVTAIVGKTGIGKSTLFRLILAHLHPQNGNIYFYNSNGEQIEASARTRCNCTYVPQGNSLISGSIRYNLSLGNLNASEEEMIEALKISACDFVFDSLPNGVDTKIGENGFGLSEGQAQRIAIARALLHPSSIILLDEPTSALDKDTTEILLNRMRRFCKDKTIIIISHDNNIDTYIDNTLHISHE